MLGAFASTQVRCGGLLWKTPWRMSDSRKANVRKRLKAVDQVISVVRASGIQTDALTRALALPRECEMSARDKYTTFCKSSPGHRKSLHKVPKFTRITRRTNPAGF
ncbi:uncharacterized protein L969DRAFT_96037 [Mixia osmundae IAM 14324]|uniref:54S ribosomal protein L31, mitochondrial n=1 Tax=Mixia osmundae (strain CBS 9802 / IAM 14324 / JCM 22182 / KY 12970) TaxID=764103 RepID=G7DS79_MIXOS|nr:uncharacterized protein L969DRAFT_96037 [Mixia osmundae IAM 14324]KEI37508.1 hypothetical protein L969DRAFT_96037 [Mixia osmundae IAM 14324]GAA93439.1 hypothetical protein E5Q_00080 [Mixia osmundae IAM 14324]